MNMKKSFLGKKYAKPFKYVFRKNYYYLCVSGKLYIFENIYFISVHRVWFYVMIFKHANNFVSFVFFADMDQSIISLIQIHVDRSIQPTTTTTTDTISSAAVLPSVECGNFSNTWKVTANKQKTHQRTYWPNLYI